MFEKSEIEKRFKKAAKKHVEELIRNGEEFDEGTWELEEEFYKGGVFSRKYVDRSTGVVAEIEVKMKTQDGARYLAVYVWRDDDGEIWNSMRSNKYYEEE